MSPGTRNFAMNWRKQQSSKAWSGKQAGKYGEEEKDVIKDIFNTHLNNCIDAGDIAISHACSQRDQVESGE